MTKATRGFTLIEMLVVIAIIAILALIALPSYQSRIVRRQVVEGAALANIAKPTIAASWGSAKVLPADNATAGLPVAEKIVSDLVSKVTVQDGAIHITYGNSANSVIRGKVLTLRPAVVDDAQIVPVTWVCGTATPPAGMTLKGSDKTDIPSVFLPINCKPH